MNKNSIKNSVKSKTFFRDMILYGFMKLGFFSNYTRGLITMDRTFYKLEKKYKKKIKEMKMEQNAEHKDSDYIWFCWLQGIEKAPRIVQKCFESVQKWYPDKQIIVITEENYQNYADIPDYMIDKWKRKIITNTHFSDILRLALLVKNGGLWIDSTVFCTGNSWKELQKNNLFVYRNGWMDMEIINMASWLIYAKTNNDILSVTLKLLYEYWKKNNYLCDYFLLHMFFSMVTKEFEEEWNQVPYFSQVDNHLLSRELLSEFDLNKYERIKKLTNFHKLTYKLEIDKKLNKDTFYTRIINE